MKKSYLLLLLFISLNAFGQNKVSLEDVDEVTFYGVDFSQVRIFGASETYDQFKTAFDGINNLFLTEPKKYKVSDFIDKDVNGINIEVAIKRLKLLDRKEFRTTNENYEIDEDALNGIIKDLKIKESEGVGLILVAQMLNKAKNTGYFHVVYFDIKSREIIDSWLAGEKAKGFGLRNFWARSVYSVLKKSGK